MDPERLSAQPRHGHPVDQPRPQLKKMILAESIRFSTSEYIGLRAQACTYIIPKANQNCQLQFCCSGPYYTTPVLLYIISTWKLEACDKAIIAHAYKRFKLTFNPAF